MLLTTGFQIVFSLLILWTQLVFAAVPYTPSHIFLSPQNHDSLVYILQTNSSAENGFEFLSLNFSGDIDTTNLQYATLTQPGQFWNDKNGGAIIPVMDQEGILKIYAGSCNSSASGGAVWHFTPDNNSTTGDGTWMKSSIDLDSISTSGNISGPSYLAAGFAYSMYNGSSSSVYSFGGMCPFNSTTGQNWVSTANYSRSMVVLNPDDNTAPIYDAEISDARGSPIAEAGFTITPLQPAFSNTSTGKVLEQQTFILVGGHTQNAFTNMSEIAVFSLPESGWTYADVAQPNAGKSELAIRDVSEVEPRSGHSAILSSDGSKIIIFGGWVGDTSTPATPQLAILEINENYGGTGQWIWSIPSQSTGLPEGSGIFGHGAAMLPGDIMMIVGGYSIPSTSAKRSTSDPVSNSNVYLYNMTSHTWASSYTNPHQYSQKHSGSKSGGLSSTSQKVGLGAGLGGGVVALVCVGLVLFLCCRKHRARRRSRDLQLRKLALGAERSHFWSEPDMASSIHRPMSEVGMANALGIYPDNVYPWAGNTGFGDAASWNDAENAKAQRTGVFMDVPSPTRGLRKNMHSRPYRYQSAATYDDSRRPAISGAIPPIDEREEYEVNSSENQHLVDQEPCKRDSQISQASDPFVDPASSPLLRLSPTKNRQSWMSEGEPMLGYNSPDGLRSGSPNKSERTASSLSESSGSRSAFVVQNDGNDECEGRRRHGQSSDIVMPDQDLSRINETQHSPERFSIRSVGSQTQEQSSYSGIGFPFEQSRTADSFTTAHTSLPQSQAEGESLLGKDPEWATPPETPVKGSSSTKSKALDWIGSVRKALGRAKEGDLDKPSASGPIALKSDQMSTASDPANKTTYKYQLPRRAVSTSAAALKRRKGAKDWGAGKSVSGEGSRSLSQTAEFPMYNFRDDGDADDEDEDWDVEAAAEGRLVQVTFTVPKEKLRVVNAGSGELDDDDTDRMSPASSRAVSQRVSSK